MAGLRALGGACEVLVYKDGTVWNRSNFPVFFNSIAKVSAIVAVEQMAQIKIEVTPSFNDALTILASGILGTSTGAAGQTPSTALDKSVTPTSVSSSATASSSTATVTAPSNAPFYAVRFFYPGEEDASTDWYGGLAVQPGLSMNNGEVTINLNIIGQHGLMQMNQGPKTFNNESAFDVITKLAAKFKVELEFDDDDDETKAILQKETITGQYNENDESIIRRILMKLRCHVVKDQGGTNSKARYLVKSLKYLHSQPIDYHFVALRQVQPEKNVIPLLSFDLSSTGTMFYPGATFGIYSTAVMSSTKEIKKFASTPNDAESDSTNATSSDSGAMPEDTGDGDEKGGATGKVDTSDPDEAGVSQPALGNDAMDTLDIMAARSEIARSEQMEFHAETYGLPDIQPLIMAQLTIGPGEKGIEAFSGPVSVKGLEHIWDSNGWHTSMKLYKTGGATSISNAKIKASEPVKTPDKMVSKSPAKV